MSARGAAPETFRWTGSATLCWPIDLPTTRPVDLGTSPDDRPLGLAVPT